ncbi:hypothetical protein Tco_0680857 [Tanacetum coccineum]|uniref:Uncharacterized protein n=1 Tax=Tanacetum coccineum TaxID=301880 RepID=A0ABQ4XMW0_9ASTR
MRSFRSASSGYSKSLFIGSYCIADDIIMDAPKVEASQMERPSTVSEVDILRFKVLKPYETELNMRQRDGLEPLKDYDTKHPSYLTGKANVVPTHLVENWDDCLFDYIILHDLERLDVVLCVRGFWWLLGGVGIELTHATDSKIAQRVDDRYVFQMIGTSREGYDVKLIVLIYYSSEIRSLRLVIGKDYRKLAELVLVKYSISSSKPVKHVVHLSCWMKERERLIEGPVLIEITNEKVAVAKEKLKEARSRQKSYADKHRRDLEFQVGDRVFLNVSPFRGVKRFGSKAKLVLDSSIQPGYCPLSEEPESVLDRQERVMRNKVIPFMKIL